MIFPATFSIVACDLEEKTWGVAVASKFLAVGSAVPWAKAEVGAIATQSYANTSYGPNGLALIASGLSAEDTLSKLISDDNDRELRQIGIVDKHGSSATFTGKDCYSWAGGVKGSGYAIQGNILVGEQVVISMKKAFKKTKGTLPDRLYAALSAGDQAGGDKRGRQSAAIYVVKPKGGYGGFNDRWIDYRVDDHENPIRRLGGLLELHELYFGKSPDNQRLKLAGKTLIQLQEIIYKLGYYKGPLEGKLDEATSMALYAFIGNENFEDRFDARAGLIDQPVYNFLMKKYGK